MQNIVNEYKAATLAVARRAQQMSEALLVRITGKRVYNDLEFEEDQREHRALLQKKLVNFHEDCIAIMRQTYEVFKHDGPEVRRPGGAMAWFIMGFSSCATEFISVNWTTLSGSMCQQWYPPLCVGTLEHLKARQP